MLVGVGGVLAGAASKVQPILFGGVYHNQLVVVSFPTFKRDDVSAEC